MTFHEILRQFHAKKEFKKDAKVLVSYLEALLMTFK
jgi:hypothetical protein